MIYSKSITVSEGISFERAAGSSWGPELITAVWNQQDPERTWSINAAIV